MDRSVGWQASGVDPKGFADTHVQVWEKPICDCTFSAPCTVTGMTFLISAPNTPFGKTRMCSRREDKPGRMDGLLRWADTLIDVVWQGKQARGGELQRPEYVHNP